jgi:hypothetical protein
MIKFKTFLFSILMFGLVFPAMAETTSKELAATVAKNLYIERAGLLAGDVSVSLEEAIPYLNGNTVLFYIFNIKNNNGFVIIAADDRAMPVLGYALSGSYGKTAPPAAFDWMLLQYAGQMKEIIARNIEATEQIMNTWKHFGDPGFKPALQKLQVNPMLTTTWDQGCNYNDSCPVDPTSWSCNRALTGCVATATAQIIKYHNFPATGSGRHSYVHADYGTLHANYGATTYNWSSMPNSLNNGNAAVAQLMFHVGVGVEMGYGPQESGAPSSKVAMALIHFFNYDQGAHIVQRSDFTDPAWNALMRTELDNQRPVYYSGFEPSAGHAFVCDGYQSSDYFHFNWGWSGAYDGYFYLSNLNPGWYTFNDHQEAVVGIKPGVPQACAGSTTLTAWEGDFTEGSYSTDYQNNASCEWLIQPINNPAYISLEFMTFKTEASNDIVKVYDGNSAAAPLIGTFSGSNIPPVINSTGNTLFVQFISNGSVTNKGWSARYTGHFCYPNAAMIAPNGTFSDGSGSLDYFNLTDCYWLIMQPANVQIALIFNSFDTEQDYDFVDVYDGPDTMAPLLGSFSGSNLPPTLLSSGSQMLVHFNSDAGVTSAGWQATYTTSVGISEHRQNSLNIWPNPASERIFVDMSDFEGTKTITMNDLLGKELKSIVLNRQEGNISLSVDVSGMSPGCYILRVENQYKRAFMPIIIR